MAEAAEEFPGFAWALSDPELGPLLREAAGPPAWTPAKLQARLQQTQWWRTNSAAVRNYMTLAGTDPAELGRRLHDVDAGMKIQQWTAQYGLPQISLHSAIVRGSRVVRGEIQPEQMLEEIRNQAKALYPHLASRIDAGVNVEDIFEPYRNLVAQELGIAAETVHLQDPQWQKFLIRPLAGGEMRAWTLDEVQSEVRNNSTYGWDRTTAAKEAATELRVGLEEGLGLRR